MNPQELQQYLLDHPIALAALGMFALLAAVGAWYVVSHHLHSVLITLLCAAGFVSGILVLYRGYSDGKHELMVIGAFLIIIFPIIYQQAIHMAQLAYGSKPHAVGKGHARRAGL